MLQDSVVPKIGNDNFKNIMGLQMTGWGIGATAAPVWMLNTLFGVTIAGTSIPLMRAMGVGMLALGAATCKGSRSDAATSGIIFYGGWYKLLTDGLAAGTMAGYGSTIALWNGLCALLCVRELSLLDWLLPKDSALTARNIVGLNVAGWGVITLFFKKFFFGAKLLGVSTAKVVASPFLMMTASGIALCNLVLGGRILAGSNGEAATVGSWLFAGYALIGYLAQKSGAFAGSWMGACNILNLAIALYCLKEKN